MDLEKEWTESGGAAEAHEFGTRRMVREHNKLRAEAHLLRLKLRRVRDWLKFAANSEGGVVAELDEVLQDHWQPPSQRGDQGEKMVGR